MGMQMEASDLEGRQMIVCEQGGSVHIQLREITAPAIQLDGPSDAQASCCGQEAADPPPAEACPVPALPQQAADNLYGALVDLRNHIAGKEGKKPYLIFHDETLRQISCCRPQAIEDLLTIKGIGKAKAQQYGMLILDVIRRSKFEAPAESEVG
jgi:superfamily II DNA helicase RecQ